MMSGSWGGVLTLRADEWILDRWRISHVLENYIHNIYIYTHTHTCTHILWRSWRRRGNTRKTWSLPSDLTVLSIHGKLPPRKVHLLHTDTMWEVLRKHTDSQRDFQSHSAHQGQHLYSGSHIHWGWEKITQVTCKKSPREHISWQLKADIHQPGSWMEHIDSPFFYNIQVTIYLSRAQPRTSVGILRLHSVGSPT